MKTLIKKILNDFHSKDMKLESLYRDMSIHLKGLSASDLNRNKFYHDMIQYLIKSEKEIICINYYGDDFNIGLDGDEMGGGVCPECGEEFYFMSPQNSCPKCGNNELDYEYAFYD